MEPATLYQEDSSCGKLVFDGIPSGYIEVLKEYADHRFKGDLALALCDIIDRNLVIQPMFIDIEDRLSVLEGKPQEPKTTIKRKMIDGTEVEVKKR